MKEGTSRARAWAICHTRSAALSLHLPPVSMATTTSRQRPDATSSGYFASLSRLAWSIQCGPVHVGNLWMRFSVFAQDAAEGDVDCKLDSVEARQVLGQHLDARLVCSSDAYVHIAKVRVELDTNPGLSANSRKHLLGGCGPLANPSCARARCSVAPPGVERFLTSVAPCVADGQGESQPLQKQHTKQVCGNRVLGNRQGMSERDACISARVGPQISTTRCRAAGQHGYLPERGVSNGRRPVLPAVLPLAGIPCFAWVGPVALPHFVPTWSPPETLLVKHRGNLVQFTENNQMLVVQRSSKLFTTKLAIWGARPRTREGRQLLNFSVCHV